MVFKTRRKISRNTMIVGGINEISQVYKGVSVMEELLLLLAEPLFLLVAEKGLFWRFFTPQDAGN